MGREFAGSSPEEAQVTPAVELPVAGEHVPPSPEHAVAYRVEQFAHTADSYQALALACQNEGRFFGVTEVDRMLDAAEQAPPAHRDTVRRFTINMMLGNPGLHEDMRASMIAELAQAA